MTEFDEVPSLLLHVRIMRRFFEDIVATDPALREHYPKLDIGYRRILNEELAPHALTLALALAETWPER